MQEKNSLKFEIELSNEHIIKGSGVTQESLSRYLGLVSPNFNILSFQV
jgi:hypothetical protein